MSIHRVRRHRQKKYQDRFVDWWNAEAGKHPQGEFTSRMIEVGSLPGIHTGRETWLTAVPKAFKKAEEEAAPVYWVQQRRYPPRTRNELAPWPGARKWFPRRWFGPCPFGEPLQISVAGAAWRDWELEDRDIWDGFYKRVPQRRSAQFYYQRYWTIEGGKLVLHEPRREPVSTWRPRGKFWGRIFPLPSTPLLDEQRNVDPLDRLAASAAFEAA